MAIELHQLPDVTAQQDVVVSDKSTPAGTGYAPISNVVGTIAESGEAAADDTVLARAGGTGVPVFRRLRLPHSNTEYIDSQSSNYSISAAQCTARKTLVFTGVAANIDVTLPAGITGTAADGKLSGCGVVFLSNDGTERTVTLKVQAGEHIGGVTDAAVSIPVGGSIWLDSYVDDGGYRVFTANFRNQTSGAIYHDPEDGDVALGNASTNKNSPTWVTNWSEEASSNNGVTVNLVSGEITITKTGVYQFMATVGVEWDDKDLVLGLYGDETGTGSSYAYLEIAAVFGDTSDIGGGSTAIIGQGIVEAGTRLRVGIWSHDGNSGKAATFISGQLNIMEIGGILP